MMGGNTGILSPITLRTEAGLALQSSQVGPLFIPEVGSDPLLAMTKLRQDRKDQGHKDGLLTATES